LQPLQLNKFKTGITKTEKQAKREKTKNNNNSKRENTKNGLFKQNIMGKHHQTQKQTQINQ
jgi:hypothetical protein